MINIEYLETIGVTVKTSDKFPRFDKVTVLEKLDGSLIKVWKQQKENSILPFTTVTTDIMVTV